VDHSAHAAIREEIPMNSWDPHQYAAFNAERSRPFFDLLGRIPDRGYARIIDLGCGSGELTRILAERWPAAKVTGVDSSPEMLASAEAYAIPGRLDFARGDIASFAEPADLLFSNAALQWVADHETLVPRLASLVRPGGCFAAQIPTNFEGPSHRILAELAREGPWAPKLANGWRADPVRRPGFYVRALWELGFKVDAWETEYQQVLQGEDAVLEWTRGTGLRPVLALLDEQEAAGYTDAYRQRLREAYPSTPYGTLFPFRRAFWVATRE
jgi:trans-aconitate 2-methyltransferase